MGCVSSEMLRDFLLDQLSESQAQELAEHLAGCAHCQAALDAGAVFATESRPIGPDETSEDVERDLAEQGMKAFGGSFPVDVWIDHDGLPRRFSIDIEIPGGKGSVKERIDFTDYGTPVSIEAPPAGQVQSMADFEHTANGV